LLALLELMQDSKVSPIAASTRGLVSGSRFRFFIDHWRRQLAEEAALKPPSEAPAGTSDEIRSTVAGLLTAIFPSGERVYFLELR